MKRMKGIGIIALVLAGVVLLAGIFSLALRGDSRLFASLRTSSHTAQRAVQAAQANVKETGDAVKRADAAQKSADAALKDAQAVLADIQAVQVAGDTDTIYGAARQTLAQVDPVRDSLADAGASAEATVALAEAALMEDISEQLEEAGEAVEDAEKDLAAGRTAVLGAYQALGQEAPVVGPEAYEAPAIEEETEPLAMAAVSAQALVLRAEWMAEQAAVLPPLAEPLPAIAAEAQQGVSIGTVDRIVHWLSTYYIFLMFTGVLLLALGVLFTFFGEAFLRQWKANPVFSTFVALIIMMIIQVYSMKFTYNSVGEWAKFWFDNAFNVLRANTSVGMIALGMTMVIITGGIDLAVGSTLAGVGTVVMVLLDTSSRGILLGLGITGVPAFLLAILGGLLTGALIGALIGLGVTKGRVPPFIITLGVMNIVRSVAQYFTKSYTPKVPTEFTAIANTVIFGQRLLPIVYWLVLAVLVYIMMKRTRFGRYIYAVGSNERTTRLSGINVDAVKFKVYTLMGVLVSIASITQVSRLGGMDVASSGSGYELDAIAAVVVGGTSMAGGRGSILGTMIGVLIIGVMNNLLILLGVDSFLTNAFKGAIVVAAVLMQRKEKEA